MLSSVLYLLFSSSVEAHSWIQCTDYQGPTDYYDGSKCFGHVRPWQRGNNDIVSPNQVAFGVDQGFNKRMDETPDGECNTLIDNQFAAGNFPMATYRRGQTITLAWPAKNHVADFCDNNPGGDQIPDTFNGLYMENYQPGLRIRYNREVVFSPMTEGNTHVFGQIDYKGYQNCPKFCENRDKALCTGTFVVPDVPDGRYSFSWRWEFNGNRNPPEKYVTCFEAEVQGDSGEVAGMFVERGNGCNDHQTEDKCLSYADGRNGRVGERCAWCCGENCNEQGGPGGANKCEPVSFLEDNGLNRFRTVDRDQCTPPTAEPTTASPSPNPTDAPTSEPSSKPTATPTETPTRQPTSSMIAPNPGFAGALPGQAGNIGNCAPSMGQCGGMGATTNCCQAGLNCVMLNDFFSQCQPAVAASLETSSGIPVNQVVMIVALFLVCIVALCCGTALVYFKCLSNVPSDAYQKHNSLSDRDTNRGPRYSDKNERRKKKSRSRPRGDRVDSRTRGDSRSPVRTNTESSWVDG